MDSSRPDATNDPRVEVVFVGWDEPIPIFKTCCRRDESNCALMMGNTPESFLFSIDFGYRRAMRKSFFIASFDSRLRC